LTISLVQISGTFVLLVENFFIISSWQPWKWVQAKKG
jgi:hypothetical protein